MVKRKYNSKQTREFVCDSDSGVSIDSGCSKSNNNGQRFLGPTRLTDGDWCTQFQQSDVKLNSNVYVSLEEISKSKTTNQNYLQTKDISKNNTKPGKIIDVNILSMNPIKKAKLFQICFHIDGKRQLNGERLDFRPEIPAVEEGEPSEHSESFESSSSSDESSLDNDTIPEEDNKYKINLRKLDETCQRIEKKKAVWKRKLGFYPLHCTSDSLVFKNACLNCIESTSSSLSENKLCTPRQSPCISERNSPFTPSPCSQKSNNSASRISLKGKRLLEPVRRLDFSSLPTLPLHNNNHSDNNNVNNLESNVILTSSNNDLSNGLKQDLSHKLNGDVASNPQKLQFTIRKTVFCDSELPNIKVVNVQKNNNADSAQILPDKNVFSDAEIPKQKIISPQKNREGEANVPQILPPNDLANKLSRSRNKRESQVSAPSCSTTRITPINIEKTIYNDNVFKLPPTFKMIKPTQVNPLLRKNINTLKHHIKIPTKSVEDGNTAKPTISMIFPTTERLKDDDELSIFVSNDLKGDFDDLESQRLSPIDDSMLVEEDPAIEEAEKKKDNEYNGSCDNNKPTDQLDEEYLKCSKYVEQIKNFTHSNAIEHNYYPSWPPTENVYKGNYPGQFDENYNNTRQEFNNSKFRTPSLSSSSESNQFVSNKSNFALVDPVQIFRTFCRVEYCHFGEKCRFMHNVPNEFYTSLISSNIEAVREVYRLMNSNRFNNKGIYSALLYNFIQYYGHQKSILDLLVLTYDINQRYDILKTPFIERIIDTLTDSLGLDYDWAICEISSFNRREVSIADILLDIVVRKDDVLEKHWGTVKSLTSCRTVSMDVGVLEDILKKCLKVLKDDVNIKTYFVCVCQDLLLQKFVDITRIKEELLRTYVNELYKFDSKNSEILNDTYLKFKKVPLLTKVSSNVPINSGNKVNLRPPPKGTISDEDIERLTMAVKNGDVNVIIQLMHRYKFQEYTTSFAAHFLLLYRKTNHEFYHNLLMEIIRKLENSFEDRDIKRTVESLALNSIPYYDKRSDYVSGCQIIKIFMGDIQSFISSNSENIVNIKPYKGNMRTDSQKLIFLVKILTKGTYLQEAFELVQMKSFQLLTDKDPALYKYKIDKLNALFMEAYEINWQIFTKMIFYYLKSEEIVITDLKVPYFFNLYLVNILENSITDKTLLLNEYNNILLYLKYITETNLRGILVSMLIAEDKINNVAQIYEHCCGKGIYFQHNGSENAIKLKSNMTLQEIKVIVTMFFQKMLEIKSPPKRIEIDVVVVPPKKETEKLQKLFTDRCDRSATMIRLACAFSCLVPTISISDRVLDKTVELTEEETKMCLDRFIKKQEGN